MSQSRSRAGTCPGCGERVPHGEVCCYECEVCHTIGPRVRLNSEDRELCPDHWEEPEDEDDGLEPCGKCGDKIAPAYLEYAGPRTWWCSRCMAQAEDKADARRDDRLTGDA